MKIQTIEYFDGQQKLLGELFYNELIVGPRPAIIVFPAFEGRGEFALNYAKKLAEQGYIAFAADMYGDAQTSKTLDGCIKLFTPFSQDRALTRRRAVLALQTLVKQPLVMKDKIGAVGFCFGGMCALEVARSGENIRAVVSMHGVLAKSDLPTHQVKSKLLILHGYQDPQVPPDNLPQFAHEMQAAGNQDWIFTFFGDAKHSFTDPKTGTFDAKQEQEMGRVFNKVAAERSFHYAIDFFKEVL